MRDLLIPGGDGISTVCPSATPFGLALGPTNPPRMNRAEETSAIRWEGFFTFLTLLMPAFSLLSAPPDLPVELHRRHNAPLPLHVNVESAASARDLAPVDYPRERTRPVSYYALFKGWLLLSQPPGCLGTLTSFHTESRLRGLSWRSGLFPSRPWNFAPTVSLPGTTCRHSRFDWGC